MNLLMLTKFYPFGTGEAFIENEIKVLAEYYDKITIIACEVPESEKTVRELPNNVKACRIDAFSKKKDTLIGLKYLAFPNKEIKTEITECSDLLQKTFLGYFEVKSQRVFKNIIDNNYLDEITKDPFVLYSYWFFMTARVGILIADKFKPVYMFTRAHRYDLYEEKNKTKYLPYRKLFLKYYDNVFPCSNNGKEHLKKGYLNYAQNVVTSLLGTLDHGIGTGSKDGVFRVVSCSRIEPVKRVAKIIDALEILDNEKYLIEWTHIGDGAEFTNLKKDVETRLHNVPCNFLGNMKNTDVMKLYSEQPFDLFVNVSSSEGLPVSIMEAISFGIPVVATDVGGTSEIVVDEMTGTLISAEFTKEELASVIKKYASENDPEKVAIVRKSCRNFWEEHFQALTNYHKMCDYIEEQYSKKQGNLD